MVTEADKINETGVDGDNTCINLKPMAEWLEEPEQEGDCKPCRLAVIVGDYQKTLEESGNKTLSGKIADAMSEKEDPILRVAQVMDEAKEAVDEKTREELLALDCLAQRADVDKLTGIGE